MVTVFTSCSLIKGIGGIKWRTVQVKARGRFCMADTLYSMSANGIIDVGTLVFPQDSFKLLDLKFEE